MNEPPLLQRQRWTATLLLLFLRAGVEAAISVDCKTGKELVAAMENPDVEFAVITSPRVDLQPSDFAIYHLPIYINRTFNIVPAIPGSWPTINMATPLVKKTLVLGNNSQLVFTGVVVINFREDPIFMTPGLDTLEHTAPGNRALLHMKNAAFVNLACLPDPYFSKATVTAPRPPGAPPGAQTYTPLLPKAGCDTTTPVTSAAAIPDDIVNFCWPAVTTYLDVFTEGVDVDWSAAGAGKPVLTGYLLWLQNATMYCGRPMPLACVDSLTPVGCYYSINPRGNGSAAGSAPSASPPPAALPPSPNSTAYGSGTNASAGGGGGGGSSGAGDSGAGDILAPVLVGVLGGLAALAVVSVAAVWAVRRRRRRQQEHLYAPAKVLAAIGGAASGGGRHGANGGGGCAAATAEDDCEVLGSSGGGNALQHKATSASTEGLGDGLGTRTTGTVGTLGDIDHCSFSTQRTACGGGGDSVYGEAAATAAAAAAAMARPSAGLLVSTEPLTPTGRRHTRAHTFTRPNSGTAGVLPAARSASVILAGGAGGAGSAAGSPAGGSAAPGSPHHHAAAVAALRSPSGLARSLLSGAASAAGSFLSSMGVGGAGIKRSSMAGKSFVSSLPPEEEAVAAAALVPVTAQTPLQNVRTDVHCAEGGLLPSAFLVSTVTEARTPTASGLVPASADGAAAAAVGGVLPAAAPNQITLLPVVRGKGSFGRVVEGIYNGRRVAVKILSEGLYMSHLRQQPHAAVPAAAGGGGGGGAAAPAHAQAAVAPAGASDAAAGMGSAVLVDSAMGHTGGGVGTTSHKAGGVAGSWQLYASTVGAGGGGRAAADVDGGSSGGGGGGGGAGWGGMHNVQRRTGCLPSGGTPLASQEAMAPNGGGTDGGGGGDHKTPGGGLPAAAPTNWQVYESVGTVGGTAGGGGGGLGARLAGFWQQRLATVAPEAAGAGGRAGQGPPAASGSCRDGESDGSSPAGAGAAGSGARANGSADSGGAGGVDVGSHASAAAAPPLPEWQQCQYQSVGTSSGGGGGGGDGGGFVRAMHALVSSGDHAGADGTGASAAEGAAEGKEGKESAAAGEAGVGGFGAVSAVQPNRHQHVQPKRPAAAQPAQQPQHVNSLERTFMQEVEVLARCRHPNIVQLLAACLTPPRVCLVMELMETSLDKLIHGVPGRLMAMPVVLHVGCQVARALEYLHPTIIHRDLKPGNVLISDADSPTPVAKLADFGLSRLRDETLRTRNPDVGTAGYMAPELFAATAGDATVLRQTRLGGGGRHAIKNAAEREVAAEEEEAAAEKAAAAAGAGEVMQGEDQDGGGGRDREGGGGGGGTAVTDRVDVWALGVLLWEMLSGQRPWAGTNMVQVAVAVALRRERLPFTAVAAERCPPRLRALIEQCWEWDPARRPAAAEIAKELGLLRQDMLVAAGQRNPSNVFSGSNALLVPMRAGSGGMPWAASAYGGFLASGGAPSAAASPVAGGGGVAWGAAGGGAIVSGNVLVCHSMDETAAAAAVTPVGRGGSGHIISPAAAAAPPAAGAAARPQSGPWKAAPPQAPPPAQAQQPAQVPAARHTAPVRTKSRLSFSTADSRAGARASATGNAAAAGATGATGATAASTVPGEAAPAAAAGAAAQGVTRPPSAAVYTGAEAGAQPVAARTTGGERASGSQSVVLVVPAGPGPGAGALGVRAEEAEAEAAAAKYPAERWVPRRR